jgi:hypothetical protein
MKWLLRLYPPAWRRRYEAEMAVLLEEQRAGTRGAWDLVRGAADAWIVGPRGPFGGLEMWLAALAYASTFLIMAVIRRLGPADWPWDTLSQLLFWSLFIVLTTWRATQPWSRVNDPRVPRT